MALISRRRLLQLGLAAPAGLVASKVTASQGIIAPVFDLARYGVSLHWKDSSGDPYVTLDALADALTRQGARVAAVMNAGIYDRNHAPLGLHVEEGAVLRPLNHGDGDGNFYLKPNGVFSIASAAARVVETSAFRLTDDVSVATQSGPLLLDEGAIHPAFRRQSTSRRTRNAIGVREDGEVVLAISRQPVTFWDFATIMRDGAGCRSALYLDGAISQLWQSGGDPPESRYSYVGMMAVTER